MNEKTKQNIIKGGAIVGCGVLAYALTPWWLILGAGAGVAYWKKDKIKNIIGK
jgi:hypothetical protein